MNRKSPISVARQCSESDDKEFPTELPLFRQEILDSRTNRLSGPIVLTQPISRKAITLISALLVFSIILFFVTGNVNRSAHVSGITVPINGALPILSPGGEITAIEVVEGQYVEKGTRLFTLSNEQISKDGDIIASIANQLKLKRQAQESQLNSRIKQFDDDKNGLMRKIDNSALEQDQIKDEIELAKSRLDLAKQDLENFEKLREAGFISITQRQQKEKELLDVKSRLKTLQRSFTIAKRSNMEITENLQTLRSHLDIDISQINSSISTIDQQLIENEAKKTNVIIASQSGFISTINVKLGQIAIRDRSLGMLIPAANSNNSVARLEVQLFVPSQMIGFVEPNQNVFIRYPAYPYQLFGLQRGKILDVSQTPLISSEMPDLVASMIATANTAPANTREALYRVRVLIESQTVTAYGREYTLRPGMALEADIVREKQKVWELLFSPALAILRKNSN